MNKRRLDKDKRKYKNLKLKKERKFRQINRRNERKKKDGKFI